MFKKDFKYIKEQTPEDDPTSVAGKPGVDDLDTPEDLLEPEKNDDEQKTEETPQKTKLPEYDKEYFGSKDTISYTLVRDKSDSDEVNDLQITEAEGNNVFSAKDNGLDVNDVPGFIEMALKEVDVDEVSYDLVMRYFIRPAEEEMEAEEDLEREEEAEEVKDEEESLEDIEIPSSTVGEITPESKIQEKDMKKIQIGDTVKYRPNFGRDEVVEDVVVAIEVDIDEKLNGTRVSEIEESKVTDSDTVILCFENGWAYGFQLGDEKEPVPIKTVKENTKKRKDERLNKPRTKTTASKINRKKKVIEKLDEQEDIDMIHDFMSLLDK